MFIDNILLLCFNLSRTIDQEELMAQVAIISVARFAARDADQKAQDDYIQAVHHFNMRKSKSLKLVNSKKVNSNLPI